MLGISSVYTPVNSDASKIYAQLCQLSKNHQGAQVGKSRSLQAAVSFPRRKRYIRSLVVESSFLYFPF